MKKKLSTFICWLRIRENSFGVDSDSDEIVSAVTQVCKKIVPALTQSSSFIKPPATRHYQWARAQKHFLKFFLYNTTNDKMITDGRKTKVKILDLQI